MVTVNQTRDHLTSHKTYFTPETHKFILGGLNQLSEKKKDIDDFRTIVIFLWQGHRISLESVEKLLLGVHTIPIGFTMMINMCSGKVH